MGVTAFANAAKAELLASKAKAKVHAAQTAKAELLASKAKAEAQEAQTQATLALQQMMAAEKQSSDLKATAEEATKYADDLWNRYRGICQGRDRLRLGPPLLCGF